MTLLLGPWFRGSNGHAQAHANFLDILRHASAFDVNAESTEASERHVAALQYALVDPIRDRAVLSKDAVVRNAGIVASHVFELTHTMSPYIQERVERHLRTAQGNDEFPTQEVNSFLALVQKSFNMARDLSRLGM